jgi:aryl-alcohol dehydrogenase-like predicted oxidoreductase
LRRFAADDNLERVEEESMQQRTLGKTGQSVSVLGFGCGAVGGLMVRGAPADQERAVARAVEAGITYFDTAAMYGNGLSEQNLGRVLASLRPNVLVGTKVRLTDTEKANIGAAVAASLDASLRRLRRDQVDLFQLHNAISERDSPGAVSADVVLTEVVPALERLRAQGKTRYIGITATGDTAALYRVIRAGSFASAQVPYNMLNPSPGGVVPSGYPAQDYQNLLGVMQSAGTGAIGIRVLAGGALSADAARHPIASPPPEPIGTAQSYEADLTRAGRLLPLVTEGYATSLPEAALRYVIAHPGMSTVLIGLATIEQLDKAIAAIEKGPLSATALRRVEELQRQFAGEAR